MGTLANFLLYNGIGQNLTAGIITLALGYGWSKTKFWPLRALHMHINALHASHAALHASHLELHRKLDALTPAGPSGAATHPALERRATSSPTR